MTRKQKLISIFLCSVLLLGAFCCTAFAVNVADDPPRRDYFHYPDEPVASVYDYNAPGFARGIYLTTDAEDAGWAYYQNKLYNCLGLYVYYELPDPYGRESYWSTDLSAMHSKSIVRFDDTNIRFRVYNLSTSDDGIMHFFLSGYTDEQLNGMKLYHDSVSSSNELQFNFARIPLPDNSYLVDGKFYDFMGSRVSWNIPYSIQYDAILVTFLWDHSYSGFYLEFYDAYYPNTLMPFDNLIEEVLDIPSWLPTDIITWLSSFFVNNYLHYCLIVVGMVGLISIISRWAG